MQNNTSLIKVWDPLVRIFHWSLVLSFFLAYVTEEDFISIHTFAGYAVLVLLLIRIVWGFIGTRHARFTDFVYSAQNIKQFLKDTVKLKAKRYIGHNPAGGAMILMMIISLLAASVSGVALYGAEDQAGPLASWFSQGHSFWGDVLEEVHEFFANFSLLLVFIHVAGVIIESMIHKENLAKSMINGMKRSDNHNQ
ncbi:MAG: cytochrome b/b6 domain-containing protein [Gammaproteobacteria bacterium]|nr:cytochrome b/b6 domain-containing protein [Gammaproteobacteria bacterium]